MLNSMDELIALEIRMYVSYCQLAAKHDELESFHRMAAHKLFYHIQELRSTGKASILGVVSDSN